MRRLTIALFLTAATACLGADDAGAPVEPTPGTRVVTGLITDLTDERMTVRAAGDGSEFVFTLPDDPPVSVDHLRVHMEGRLPVRVTYRQESTQLIPVAIDDV